MSVAAIGHNLPPEPTPYEAVVTHVDDLLLECRNFADGTPIENQAQADAVARLLEDLRLAEKAADDVRRDEVRPLDEQRDAIQARFNAYIAPLKNKQPGKIPVAMAALKATLTPWLLKLDAEKREAERLAREEAERAASAAAEAMRVANPDNLAEREEAEIKVAEANIAQAAAGRAANDKAHAKGDGRAIGLRKFYRPVMTVQRDAILHYMKVQPAAFVALVQQLAEQDVREGKRQIPGFNVIEEARV